MICHVYRPCSFTPGYISNSFVHIDSNFRLPSPTVIEALFSHHVPSTPPPFSTSSRFHDYLSHILASLPSEKWYCRILHAYEEFIRRSHGEIRNAIDLSNDQAASKNVGSPPAKHPSLQEDPLEHGPVNHAKNKLSSPKEYHDIFVQKLHARV